MKTIVGATAYVTEDIVQQNLISDMLVSLDSGEVNSLKVWSQRKSHTFLTVEDHERLRNPEKCRRPIPITDSKLWHYMTIVNRMAHGSEYLLNQDGGPVVKHLIALVRLMRAKLLPNTEFTHASVLR